MKTRSGFVSNSSSASYIVRIHDVSIMDFCDTIAQEFQYDYFDPQQLIERFEDDNLRLSGCTFFTDRLQKQEGIRERLKELKKVTEYGGYEYIQPDAELITDILNEYYQIDTKFYNGDIILTGGTIMHNSIADIPDLLKCICMYYMFEIKKVLECKVDHD